MYLIKGKYYERKSSFYNFLDLSLLSPSSVWNILCSTLLLDVLWGREVEFHSPIKQWQIYVYVGYSRSGRKMSIHFVHLWILYFKSSKNNADSVACCTTIFSKHSATTDALIIRWEELFLSCWYQTTFCVIRHHVTLLPHHDLLQIYCHQKFSSAVATDDNLLVKIFCRIHS